MVLKALLSRVLSAPDSPTADLYFLNACGDFLDLGVERLAPTVFASGETCLVMRHALRAGRLPHRRRLVYLVDDDVAAGRADASLPFLYRQKLKLVEDPAARRFARAAGTVIVTTPHLRAQVPKGLRAHLLRPYWSEPMARLDHFTSAEEGGPVDIAYLGSMSHRADLEFLLPAVARLLDDAPQVRFHVPARHRLPAALDAHPRVLRIPGLGWTAYRRELTQRRFHISLYPLMETPFNQGRSVNKLIENAIVGAAPFYSQSWAEADRARRAGAAICLPNDPEAWFKSLARLVRYPAGMRRVAAGAQTLAQRLNDPGPQRQLWTELFGIDMRGGLRERRVA